MEKVRLTLDELHVQSFATTEHETGRRGTVRGHDAPSDQVECPTANQAWDTCWGSCAWSCGCSDSCQCETANCSVDCYSDWCTWDCYTWGNWYSFCW